MEPTPHVRVRSSLGTLPRWSWWGATALSLAVAVWITGSRPRVVEAQAPRVHRGEAEPRVRTEYKQTEVAYTQIAQTINEWEAKGWETFQVVPIQTANLGVGGPMKAAIIFRHPTR